MGFSQANAQDESDDEHEASSNAFHLDTNPLGLSPYLNYQLGDGWYVGNGDMAAQYDWDSKKFCLPIGVRVGKVAVKPDGSWNVYFEYQTSLIYDDWPGATVENSYRFNVSYTWPLGK